MARRVADAEAVINLSVKGTSESVGKLRQVGNVVEEIQNGSNIDFKIGVGKNGALQIKKIVEEYKNEFSSFSIEDSFKEQLNNLTGKAKSEAEQLQQILEAGIDAVKNKTQATGNEVMSPELKSLNNQLEEQKKILKENSDIIDDYKKRINDLNNQKIDTSDIDKQLEKKLKERKKYDTARRKDSTDTFTLQDDFDSAYRTYKNDPNSREKQIKALVQKNLLDNAFNSEAENQTKSIENKDQRKIERKEWYNDFIEQEFKNGTSYIDIFDELNSLIEENDKSFENEVNELTDKEQSKIDNSNAKIKEAQKKYSDVNKEIASLQSEKEKVNNSPIDEQINQLQKKITEAEQIKNQAESSIKELENSINNLKAQEFNNNNNLVGRTKSSGTNSGDGEDNHVKNILGIGKDGYVPINVKISNMEDVANQIEGREYNINIIPSNIDEFSNKIESKLGASNAISNSSETTENVDTQKISETEIQNQIYKLFNNIIGIVDNRIFENKDIDSLVGRYNGSKFQTNPYTGEAKGIKTAVKNYKNALDSKNAEDIESTESRLIAMLSTLDKIDGKISGLTKKEQAFLNESGILKRVNDAKQGLQSLSDEINPEISKMMELINSLDGKSFDNFNLKDFKENFLFGNVNQASKSLKENFDIDLNNIASQTNQAKNIIQQTKTKIENESIEIKIDADVSNLKKKYDNVIKNFSKMKPIELSSEANKLYENVKKNGGSFSDNDKMRLLAIGNASRNYNISRLENNGIKNAKSITDTGLFQYAAKDNGFNIKDVSTMLSDFAQKIGVEFLDTANNLNQDDKQIYDYIKNKEADYQKSDSSTILTEIKSLLETSVNTKTPLNDAQNMDLVAMTRSYKQKTGKDNVASAILKGLGINNFDNIFAGKRQPIQDAFDRAFNYYANQINEEDEERKANIKARAEQRKKNRQNSQTHESNPTDEELALEEKRNRIAESLKRAKAKGKSKPANEPSKVQYDVELNVKEENISSLKSKIETGINPIELEIKPEDSAFEATQQKINQLYSDIEVQQEKISKGNKDVSLLPENYNGDAYTNKNFKKGTSEVSFNKIKNELKAYNEADVAEDAANIAKVQDNLVAMLATYNNLDDAASAFGNKQKELFENIKSRVNDARIAQELLKNTSSDNSAIETGLNEDKKDFQKEVNIKLVSTPTIDELVADINKISDVEHSVHVKLEPSAEELNKQIDSVINGNNNVHSVDIAINQNSVSDISDTIKKAFGSSKETKENDGIVNLFSNISSAFENVTKNVDSSANRQVASIQKITEAVDTLVKKLEEIGTPKIGDLHKVMKEAIQASSAMKTADNKQQKEQLQIERESLKNKQEEEKILQQREKSAQQTLKTQQEDFKVQQQKVNLENKKKDREIKELDKKKKEAFLNSANDAKKEAEQEKYKKNNILKLSANELFANKSNFISAAKKSNIDIDENSVKFDSKGVMTFTQKVNDLGNSFDTVSYKMNDFNKVIQENEVIDDKWLKENATLAKVGNKEKTASELSDTFASYAKKINLEYSNLKINKSTKEISFDQIVRNANGEIETFSRTIGNVNDLLDKSIAETSGLISKENIKSTKESISTQKENTKNAILKQRKFDETVHPGMAEADIKFQSEKNNLDAKKAEEELENSLNSAIEKNVITEQQKLDVIKEINNVKEQELKLNTPDNRTSSQTTAINKAVSKYDELFGGLNDEDITNKYIDAVEVVDNKVIKIKENIIALKHEAESFVNDLETGKFENIDQQKKVNEALNNVYSKMADYNKKYKITDNMLASVITGGVSFDNLSSQNKTDIIRKTLESRFGAKGLSVGSYVDKVGSKVEFVNDEGYLVKATVKAEEYTEAIEKNTEAKIKNAQASNKMADSSEVVNAANLKLTKINSTDKLYQTSGEKWISGFKSKLSNLSQYVTGIDLVMRGWNEIQQGFGFVKEFDASLTTINQTMSTTIEELSSLGKGAIDAGKDLGATADSVLDAAAIYANANETSESILQKAKPTVLLANASGADTSIAADQIQGV